MKESVVKKWIVGIFVALYSLVSLISTIHVIEFFDLSNPHWLSVVLSIAFELGAAASLAAIVILDKTSRWLVWLLFCLITAMQMSGNMYYAYTHLVDYNGWIEMFGLIDEDPIAQKRILSFVSGGILPLVALGFIKSLVDYIRPQKTQKIEVSELPKDETEETEEEELIMINDSPTQTLEKESSVEKQPENQADTDTYQKSEDDELPRIQRRSGL